jgi:hypothetical protein
MWARIAEGIASDSRLVTENSSLTVSHGLPYLPEWMSQNEEREISWIPIVGNPAVALNRVLVPVPYRYSLKRRVGVHVCCRVVQAAIHR